MSSHDIRPQMRTTAVPWRLDEDAVERYAAWRDACVAVDEAYYAWTHASADERPGAFAAYPAALDQEESVATIYGAVIGRLRQGFPYCLQIAAEEESAAARRGPGSGVAGKPAMTASQPIGPERSLEELHTAGDQGLRVLVADQDGFARRMLQRVLQGVGEVAMTMGARDTREALELARQYRPGMLLVDIALPPEGAVELIREMVAILPRLRIVTVSAAIDRDQAVLAALRAGAIGHIDKDTAPDQIARLVLLAAAGEAVVPRRLITRLLPRWRIPPSATGDRGAAP